MFKISELCDLWKKLKDLNDYLAGSLWVAVLLATGGTILYAFRGLEGGQPLHIDITTALKILGLAFEIFGTAIVLTVALYRLGSFLDWLFDKVFKPEKDDPQRRLGREMRVARSKAVLFLESGEKDSSETAEPYQIEGIYKRAKTLYGEKTTQWKNKIKVPLEISKAARSFIIPLVLVFVYGTWPEFLPRLTAPSNFFKAYTFLSEPWAGWTSGALAVIMILLYVWLRLVHMRKLYGLVISDDSEFKQVTMNVPVQGQYELFGEGCLLVLTRIEIRRIIRRDCKLTQAFQLPFLEDLISRLEKPL